MPGIRGTTFLVEDPGADGVFDLIRIIWNTASLSFDVKDLAARLIPRLVEHFSCLIRTETSDIGSSRKSKYMASTSIFGLSAAKTNKARRAYGLAFVIFKTACSASRVTLSFPKISHASLKGFFPIPLEPFPIPLELEQ